MIRGMLEREKAVRDISAWAQLKDDRRALNELRRTVRDILRRGISVEQIGFYLSDPNERGATYIPGFGRLSRGDRIVAHAQSLQVVLDELDRLERGEFAWGLKMSKQDVARFKKEYIGAVSLEILMDRLGVNPLASAERRPGEN